MGKIIDLDEHISIKSSETIRKICDPLFQQFGFNYFRYLVRNADESFTTLCSHKELTQYFYEEGNFKRGWIDGRPFQLFHSCIETSPLNVVLYGIDEDINNFHKKCGGICAAIDVIIKQNNHCEIFSFCANNTAIYHCPTTLLKRFIFYFKEQARLLIQEAMTQKIAFPPSSFIPQEKDFKNYLIDPTSIQNFIKITPLNRFYLEHKTPNTYITPRELSCIFWIIKGKSAEETGMILGISKRTVEKHIEHLKEKLNCYKLSEMIEQINSLGLIKLIKGVKFV